MRNVTDRIRWKDIKGRVHLALNEMWTRERVGRRTQKE